MTPSYDHWLKQSVSAITSSRFQSYRGEHDVKISKFDDNTPVWDMFQKCLLMTETPYYLIVGADDQLSPHYLSVCMAGFDNPDKVAAVSTKVTLQDRHNHIIGRDSHFSAGVWNTKIAKEMGGYQEPKNGRKWGCASDLVNRAIASGYSVRMMDAYLYYATIWYGSVSKSEDKNLEEKISKLVQNKVNPDSVSLGGVHNDA